MTGSRNEVLAGMLARVGWTTEQLAGWVNYRGQVLGMSARLIERDSAVRWVQPDRGRPRASIPGDPIPELVCELLSAELRELVTPAMLGWASRRPPIYAPADQGLSLAIPWEAGSAVDSMNRVVDPEVAKRREFFELTGESLTSAVHPWLLSSKRVAASLNGDQVTHELMDTLERLAGHRRRLDDQIDGGWLLAGNRADLLLVVDLLKKAPTPRRWAGGCTVWSRSWAGWPGGPPSIPATWP